MGSMSASDAAPLPRLGEVFFDVRGNSRSMRLSWYADTGVAVFSIWQGGTCTGTFRLPMDDLARMIESLRRGPQGQRAGRRDAPGEPGQQAPPGAGPAGRGPDEGQATMAMRMPAGSGAPSGQRPDAPRPNAGTGPERTYRGDSGGYPIDPLDPAYPVPAARYPDEPSTGAYRRPAQEYGPAGPATRKARPPPTTGGPRRPATRIRPPPATTAAASPAATGASRGTFPARLTTGIHAGPGTGETPRRSTGTRTTAAATTTPATRTSRARGTTAPSSPGATAGRRAGTRVTPLTIPIPARRALRIIPAKRPPTTPGLIRPGQIMARARSGMTQLTTPWRATTVSPGNPSPMGGRPAILTTGNGDAIPAVIDG